MIPCRAGNDRCPRPLAYLFKIIFPQQLMASKYFYVKKKNKAHRCLLPAPGNPQAGVLCWAAHQSSLPQLALPKTTRMNLVPENRFLRVVLLVFLVLFHSGQRLTATAIRQDRAARSIQTLPWFDPFFVAIENH